MSGEGLQCRGGGVGGGGLLGPSVCRHLLRSDSDKNLRIHRHTARQTEGRSLYVCFYLFRVIELNFVGRVEGKPPLPPQNSDSGGEVYAG